MDIRIYKDRDDEPGTDKKHSQNKMLYVFCLIWCVSILLLLAVSPQQNTVFNNTETELLERTSFPLLD
ncbi:MAG: hypothetical protein ACD_21C00267G0007 [uncultured bacterium]|nr:MAG: hypothetical protein ACD_21C00267G0007 [uncultured bacterium]